jgi:predicted phage baseplate assembly protein
VARATHGETVAKEILGSGDGTLTNQRFTLKNKPLTYVSAATATGGETTLEVRVNDVLWSEASSLYGLNGRSQNYIVRNDNEGNSTLTFGDGTSGARLPSGQENVYARYRSGIGPVGEVEAGSLILLQDKPLGVRSVTNSLAATGAAAPATIDEARANAPLTVLTLDRVVSIKDFEDFAAAFAGIGKAQAVSLWNGEVNFAHITIAAANGDPVDATSDLYANLVQALSRVRDTSVQVRVDTFASRYFDVAAEIVIDQSYLWEKVEAAIKDSLLTDFSFTKRGFGQQVTTAEVITAIQKVDGVVGVNLTALYEYSESTALNDLLPKEPSPARWVNNQVQLAELWLINPGEAGIDLKEISS